MAIFIAEIAIDCENPILVAKFWCQVLDYEIRSEEVGLVTIGSVDPRTGEPVLTFAQVPEGKAVKNRLHLDLKDTSAGQQAAVDRLLELGATYADVGQSGDEDWIVMADPEGNEFCVLSDRIKKP